jgi:hypothetical protein
VKCRLFYRIDHDFVVTTTSRTVGYGQRTAAGGAWPEGGCANGLTAADVKCGWPELAEAAGLN